MAELVDKDKPQYTSDDLLALTDADVQEMDAQALRACLHAVEYYQSSFELADLTDKLRLRIENL